jgi:hypothetical protein
MGGDETRQRHGKRRKIVIGYPLELKFDWKTNAETHHHPSIPSG